MHGQPHINPTISVNVPTISDDLYHQIPATYIPWGKTCSPLDRLGGWTVTDCFHVSASECSASAIKFRTFTILYNCNSSSTVTHSLFCLNLSSHIVYWSWIKGPLFIVWPQHTWTNFDVLLTVHLSIFISVINLLDAQKFCFTVSLFHVSACFEQICSSSGGQNCRLVHETATHRCDNKRGCVMQFWPPDDEHSSARNM